MPEVSREVQRHRGDGGADPCGGDVGLAGGALTHTAACDMLHKGRWQTAGRQVDVSGGQRCRLGRVDWRHVSAGCDIQRRHCVIPCEPLRSGQLASVACRGGPGVVSGPEPARSLDARACENEDRLLRGRLCGSVPASDVSASYGRPPRAVRGHLYSLALGRRSAQDGTFHDIPGPRGMRPQVLDHTPVSDSDVQPSMAGGRSQSLG